MEGVHSRWEGGDNGRDIDRNGWMLKRLCHRGSNGRSSRAAEGAGTKMEGVQASF